MNQIILVALINLFVAIVFGFLLEKHPRIGVGPHEWFGLTIIWAISIALFVFKPESTLAYNTILVGVAMLPVAFAVFIAVLIISIFLIYFFPQKREKTLT